MKVKCPKCKEHYNLKLEKKYKDLTEVIKLRLSKVNAAKVEEMIKEFKMNSLNQTLNYMIDHYRLYLQIKKDLLNKGEFKLDRKTRERFNLKL